ncbi:MAG TPA: Ig-like domain-containing protein [Caulobacteraceae bacterium]|jgi:YD repeat-containing protein
MAAVVTGVGLGLERSSASVLGANGLLGAPAQGAGGDQVFVNAATGNLIDTRTDQILTGVGPNDVISEAYNSLGTYSATLGTYVPGANTNGFMAGFQRSVTGLTGTVNTAGSTVTRIASDGSNVVYTYQTTGTYAGKYLANEDGGAYDTLSYNSTASQWTWTDGATQLQEVYDAAHSGRLTSITDPNGNAVTYSYTGALLTSITTKDTGGHQDTTTLVYNGSNQLTSVQTSYWNIQAGAQQTLTQVYYAYDTLGRLSTITTDLTPQDNSIADGATYVTTYGYSGTTDLITSIAQSDGSSLTITYNGSNQVASLAQTVASGVTRTTTFNYTVAGQTSVTDPLGNVTTLVYDANHQLTQLIAPPPATGLATQVSNFAYNSMGDVTSIAGPDGAAVTNTYDASGNRLSQVDAAGNTVTWVYGARNQVLTKTEYLVPKQGATPASSPLTTYYVYDAKNNLNYTVTSDGEVTQFQYNAYGQQTSVIQYTNDTYIGANGVGAPPPPTVAASSQTITSNTASDPISLNLSGGAATTIAILSGPSHGTVSVSGPLVTYTPTAGYTGADSFTYTASNAGGTSAVATASLTVAANAGTPPAPIATSSSESVFSGSTSDPIALSLSGGAAASVTITANPTHGTLSVSGASVTYTPTAGYTGADSFTYTASNGGGTSAAATVSITVATPVLGAPPAPVAAASSETVAAGSTSDPISLKLSGGAAASLTITANPTHGTLSVSGASVTYTPTAGYTGADSFTYTAANTGGTSAAATVSLTVAPLTLGAPPAPVATASSQTVAAGSSTDPIALKLSGGAPASVTITANPTHGALGVSGTSVTYTPTVGYTGADSFTYTATNAGGTSSAATVSLTVATASSGAPPAPVTAASSQTVFTGSSSDPIALSLSGGHASGLTVTSGPAHGTVSISGGSLTYTPTAGYAGADSFTYTANNTGGTSAAAMVSLNVVAPTSGAPPAPTAAASSQTVAAGSSSDPIALKLSGGAASSVSITSGPAHGTLSVSGAGVTYTPTAGYTGADSFTYTASNAGGTSGAATVSLTVATFGAGVELTPSSFSASSNYLSEWTGLTAAGMSDGVFNTTASAWVTNADATAFIEADLGSAQPLDHIRVADVPVATSMPFGPTALNGAQVQYSNDNVNWTTVTTVSGAVDNAYTQISLGGVSARYVRLTMSGAVLNLGDFMIFSALAAPTASAVSAAVANGSSSNAVVTNVTGLASSIAIASGPAHGTATVSGSTILYTPTAGYTGADSFTYTATNASGTSAAATASITVNAPVVAPTVSSVSAAVAYGSTNDPIVLNITGAPTSVAVSSGPSHGTVSVSGTTITYTPTAGYVGADSFTYTATNAKGTSAAATASITVNAPVAAPVANAVSAAVGYGSTNDPVVLNITGAPASVAVPSGPSHGTVTISGTTITYTPTAGYTGADSFTYTATNAAGTSAAATASITVNAALAAPIANAVSAAVAYGSTNDPIVLNITGSPTSVAVGTGPSHGSVSVSGTTITYTPTAGYSGTDSFTYTATNGQGTSAAATASLTVNAALAAPVANAVSAAVAFNSTSNPVVLNITGQVTGIAVGTAPTHGTVTITGTTLTYTPTAGYTGADSFTYTATNAKGTSAAATASLTVNASLVTAAPTANAVTAAVAYDSKSNPVILNITGPASSVAVGTGPTHGTVSVSGATITYTPTAGYSGADSFTYTATNTAGTSAAATVSLTVNANSAPNVIQLNTWAGHLADLANTKRTDFTYDFRGNVASITSYGADTSTGAGDTSATTEITKTTYVYSPSGQLLMSLPGAAASAYSYQGAQRLPTDPTGQVFSYDGLGRLIATTDLTGATTTSVFNNASTTTTVTLASGLTQTSTYDKAGELISFAQSGAGVTTQTTSYKYDADGQLTTVTDPTGLSTYYLYDNDGRKTAEILADGAITEFGYNAAGQMSDTISYATKLTPAQLSTLASATATAPVKVATVRPTANAADRWTFDVYDSAHRLIETIDPSGAATVYAYDGASNLVSTTAYANLVASGTLSGLHTTPPTALVLPTASPGVDRVTRFFYDADNRLTATLDADGFLTQTQYDDAGQKVQTVAFATAAAQSLWAAGTLAQLLTSAGTNNAATEADIHTWYVYDSRGLLRGVVNGDGNVTQYHYTPLGTPDQTITGQQLSVSTLLTTPPTLATLTALSTTGAGIDITNYTYNLNGQVLTAIQSLTSGTTTTTYAYNGVGQLLSETQDSGAADARTTSTTYNVLGQVLTTTSGDGGVTHFAYDTAGRLISKTDPMGNRSLYYYDVDGRLLYQIDPAGDVAQYAYDAFGERTDTTTYATAIASATLSTLTGGFVVSALTTAVAGLTGAADTHADYNVTGTLADTIDALGTHTTFAYDAFGDVVTQTNALTSTVSTQVASAYNGLGLLTSLTRDAQSGGLHLTTSYQYDAFGRAVLMTDPNGLVRQNVYDQAGRTIQTIQDPGGAGHLNLTTTYAYNADGDVISMTDPNGAVTTYAYTLFDRSITVTTPLGIATTTTKNAWGQTVTFTDGLGHQTVYVYDADGNLTKTTDAAGAVTQAVYDLDDRATSMTDARGVVTTYTYDAASRLLTQTVDPTGLNLKTTYGYDARGETISTTDPLGVVSAITYDLDGRRTQVVSDSGAGHLNLTTTYAYDLGSRLLTMTQAAGSAAQTVTTYAYDNAGRLSQSVVNPGGLNLTTSYVYDKDGNAVARTDAAGHMTRDVYDAANRQIYSVDALGDVTQTAYDADGHVVSQHGFANQVPPTTLSGWAAQVTAAQVAAAVSAASTDEVTNYVYDSNGRLAYALDANLRVTEYDYDAASNLLDKIEYAGSITSASSYSVAYVQAQITSHGLSGASGNRTSRYVYDALGREVFCIDAMGLVTSYAYDANGNKVKTDQFATAYATAGNPTLTAMQSWATAHAIAKDRVTRILYDNAGRVAYTVDADSYVTGYTYNADGSPLTAKRYAATYAVTDTTTTASLATLIGSPSGAETTSYGYDTAGRLTSTTDPLGIVTALTLDAMGRVVDSVAASGTADAADTHFVYDAGGRLSSRTLAYGQAEAATTSYTYDGMGRALTVTDGNGYITHYTYDTNGNVLTTTDPLGAVTTNHYNAFGNLTQTTDARGDSGFFYYDLLNRLVLQVDPDNYATATTYTIGDQVASVTRYHLQTTGTPTQTTPPTVNTSSADELTSFTRDADDRLTSETDAVGATQSWTLDAFGDQLTATNQLGGTTTYAYNGRGLVTSATLPITSVTSSGSTEASSVATTYAYDGFGNRTQMVEASGLTEQRTTNYAYDLDNRLTSTVVDPGSGHLNLTTTNTYDRRGNLIETVDPNGDKTFYYYDHRDDQIAEVNALGALTAETYDKVGNKTSQVSYGSFLTTLPSTPGGAPPAAVNPTIYRQTNYTYDKDNRLTVTTVLSTAISAIYTGAYNGSSYQVSASPVNIVAQTFYDGDGNVWKAVDGDGAATYSFYDAAGRRIAQVDPLGYLTTYAVDQDGNVVTETQFATPLGAGFASGFSATTDNAPPSGTSNANDRITSFTYDKDGRRLTESRLNVAYASVGSGGGLSTGSATATITYTYNGLGEVTSQRQATGDTTTYVYDSEGRQTSFTTASYADGITPTTTDTPQTIYYYDGLGDLTRSTVGNVGSPVGSDRLTTYTYGAAGRLTSTTDASGFTQSLAYDADGNVLTDAYSRLTSSGASISEQRVSQFDALNRVTYQANADLSGSTWVYGDASQTQYDAYGEVTAKGLNGVFSQAFTYDGAGRQISTNAGNGSTVFNVYDADGNETLQIASAGTGAVNLTGDTFLAAIAADTTGGVVASAYVAGLAPTITTYDARDEVTAVISPFRQLTSTTTSTLTQSQTYDAFGDVLTQTSALGALTSFGYNTLGDETSAVEAAVSYTDNTGVIHTGVTPTVYQYFDLGGRLVAGKDANGNLTTNLLLAGSGYGGAAEQVVEQFQPDSGQMNYGYDVFGDQTKITDQLGRVETRAYDGMGRLTADTHPTVAATGVALTNYYAYDGLGQRLKTWNSQLGSLVVATTDYDSAGRVIKTVDYAGHATTNNFVWSSTLATTGMTTFGGWTETTVNSTGLTSTSVTDAFGRAIGGTDFGGYTHSYAYNAAGELITQTSSAGQSLAYTYFNTGKDSSITVDAITGTSSYTVGAYGYDALGDTILESSTYFYPSGGCLGGTMLSTSYENETASYDALGRVVSISDTGNAGAQPMSIAYEYDQNGNIVHVLANYKTVPVSGGTSASATEDYWYAYDSMNRTVISQGELVSATRGDGITGGYQGTTIAFDAAGQRISATTLSFVSNCLGVTTDDVHSEYYGYSADGYLISVQIADAQVTGNGFENTTAAQSSAYTAVAYTNDALGRLTLENDYSSAGVISHSHYSIVYNADGQMTSDQSYQTQSNGSTLYQTNTYHYNAQSSSGVWGGAYEGGQMTGVSTSAYSIASNGTRTNQPNTYYSYNYIWGILSEEQSINFDPNTSQGTIYTTTLTHDANGYLTTATISDGQPHTVSYVNSVAGQVMDRTDSAGPINEYYYLNNHSIGSVGNTGPSQTNFATAISQGINGPPAAASSANFDENYTELDPNNVDPTAQTYSVQAGDTLQSIAQLVWGDASLWYLIADDNGLSGNQTLTVGQTLNIPNDVVNIGHTSSTFKPYSANQATGYILPNAAPPPPAPHHGGCGIIGEILAAIVGVVVAIVLFQPEVFTAIAGVFSGLGTTVADIAAGAVIGAASDVASQVVELATGVESKFNWAGVALGAIGGAVSVGLTGVAGVPGADGLLKGFNTSIADGLPEDVGKFATSFVDASISSAVTQGIGVATGLQKSFSWTSVATAGVEAGVEAVVGPHLDTAFNVSAKDPITFQGFAASALTGIAGAIAGGATRSVLSGTDFGQSIIEELPNTIGQTIGQWISDGIQQAQIRAAIEKAAQAQAQIPSDQQSDPLHLSATVKVKKNDTLNQIAHDWGVSVDDILKLNPSITNPDEIEIGQIINVPAAVTQYTVVAGDTLNALSQKFGVPVDQIAITNGIKNPDYIEEGQTLSIYPAYTSGLDQDKTVSSYDAGVEQLKADWPTLTADQRRQQFLALANAALATAGVPPLAAIADDPTKVGFNASFAGSTNSMNVAPGVFTAPTVTDDFIENLASTIYHESRHAEQLFQILRLGPSMGVAKTTYSRIATPTVLNAAYAHPLNPSSLDAIYAKAFYNSEYGSGAQYRTGVLQQALALPPGVSWNAAQMQVYHAYTSLPEEADAFQVESRVVALWPAPPKPPPPAPPPAPPPSPPPPPGP